MTWAKDMRSIGSFVFVFLFALSSDSVAASISCVSAASEIEHLICDNAALFQLDSDLNDEYQRQRRDNGFADLLRRDQRAWLLDVRDECFNVDCLKAAYERRIYAVRFGRQWLTTDHANAICRDVQQSVNAGTLPSRFLTAAVSEDDATAQAVAAYKERALYSDVGVAATWHLSDGRKQRLLGRTTGGGTCSACEIVDLQAQLKAPDPEIDEDGRLRWAAWGGCDELLKVDDALIVVRDHGYRTTLVSWLAPDAVLRPLCYLEAAGDDYSTEQISSLDDELCKAARSDGIDRIAWSSKQRASIEDQAKFNRVDDKVVAEVDLDMDGQSDRVALFDYASGAGCGSYHQWLSLDSSPADSDGASLGGQIGKSELSAIRGTWSYDGLGESAQSIKLFRYRGKPFVLAGGPQGHAVVMSFWNREPQSWCEYRILPRHSIAVTYPPSLWPLPVPLSEPPW